MYLAPLVLESVQIIPTLGEKDLALKSNIFSRTTMYFLALERCIASYFTEEFL